MFCPNCGKEITGTMNFCPHCGAGLQEANSVVSVDDYPVVTATVNEIAEQQEEVLSSITSGNRIYKSESYKIVLVSTGECPVSEADEVIADLIGYTESQANSLIKEAPVEIVQYLSYEQASVLAQALTEYGLEVAVLDQDDQYTDITGTDTSIFSNTGTLLASAAAILGTIAVANRVREFRRHKKPSLLHRLFHLRFRKKERVPHIRRPIHRPYNDHASRPQMHHEPVHNAKPAMHTQPMHQSRPEGHMNASHSAPGSHSPAGAQNGSHGPSVQQGRQQSHGGPGHNEGNRGKFSK